MEIDKYAKQNNGHTWAQWNFWALRQGILCQEDPDPPSDSEDRINSFPRWRGKEPLRPLNFPETRHYFNHGGVGAGGRANIPPNIPEVVGG